ncbi:MAG: TolC family protein [Woeseiaceae bacterium]|nr:TolC family protein [Woeseiaceae bacterium]
MHAAFRLTGSFVAVFAFVLLFGATPVYAQQRFDVAVINDGNGDRLADVRRIYVDEFLALTENEFDVRVRYFPGAWSQQSIEAAFEAAYADPEIDLVLITGFISSQIGTQRKDFPKPTFLPLILDPGLLASPPTDGKSGIPNLSYLIIYSDFGEDLDALSELVDVDEVALFIDAELSESIPQLRVSANAVSEQRGIELTEIRYDGIDPSLVDRVPEGIDAVFVSGLPRMPEVDFLAMVEAINARGLASYSFVGTRDVEAGLLMTSSETRDIGRQARLNALNMQAVMLGERAEDQSVFATARKQYTINMATARRLGISPSFNILSVATLLNEEPEVTGEEYGLVEVAERALRQNPDLVSQSFGTEAGARDIDSARADLLPQLDASAAYDLRKESPLVESGLFAQRSTDAALGLQQVIYADPLAANLTIQRQLQVAREASLSEFRLDIVQLAATSYYSVLNARSQLKVEENNLVVTRRNLDLAKDRVELGTSSSADIYRWEAEQARARIRVLDARAAVDQSWNQLNRVLNLPQNERLPLREASFDEPFVISRREFDSLVTRPADYALFADIVVARGIGRAPEIQQIDAQLRAKERELKSLRRETWLPKFSVGGQYLSNLGQSGTGAGPGAGQDLNDWSVGLQATVPLFTGGGRRADVSRASLEFSQLRALRVSAVAKVEERIRQQLHAAAADYGRIDLSQAAADSARRNFELVADAYARGAVTIIELLDAQDASLSADAAAANSLYRFLTTIMALQRAAGDFDFMLGPDERAARATELRDNLRRPPR